MSFKQFLAKEARTYEYSSLLVELPEELTDNIISWGFDHVPNEHLFSDPKDPTFGREDDVHITVIYGLHTSNPKDVKPILSESDPVKCTLGKLSLFTKNDKFDVLIISVDSKSLHELNRKLNLSLDVTENYPEFIPHVTIAYLKKGVGKEYVGNDVFNNEEFTVNELIFSSKTGEKTTIPIGAA